MSPVKDICETYRLKSLLGQSKQSMGRFRWFQVLSRFRLLVCWILWLSFGKFKEPQNRLSHLNNHPTTSWRLRLGDAWSRWCFVTKLALVLFDVHLVCLFSAGILPLVRHLGHKSFGCSSGRFILLQSRKKARGESRYRFGCVGHIFTPFFVCIAAYSALTLTWFIRAPIGIYGSPYRMGFTAFWIARSPDD